MEKDIIQLGIGFFLASGVLKLLEYSIGLLAKRNQSQNGLTTLNKISNNDLNHIYSEMLHQTEQHNEQIKLLTEICVILRERK